MTVGFKVKFYWYQIGHGDFLHSFFSTVAYRLMTANRFRLRERQRSCLTGWQNTSRLQRWRSLQSRSRENSGA